MTKTFTCLCDDHRKVVKTIKSCKTLPQLLVSREMIRNFIKTSDTIWLFNTSLEIEYQIKMKEILDKSEEINKSY